MKKRIVSIMVIIAVVLSFTTFVSAAITSTSGYSTQYYGSSLCKSSWIKAKNNSILIPSASYTWSVQGRTRLMTVAGNVLSSGSYVSLHYTYYDTVRSGWVEYSNTTSYAADFYQRHKLVTLLYTKYYDWEYVTSW